jgi:hypothetical protein
MKMPKHIAKAIAILVACCGASAAILISTGVTASATDSQRHAEAQQPAGSSQSRSEQAFRDASTNAPVEEEAPGGEVGNSGLIKMAHALAEGYGDGSATNLEVVRGLPFHQALTEITDEEVQDEKGPQTVDVMQEEGAFTAPDVPEGTQAVTGSILTIVVNQKTGDPVYIGMSGPPTLRPDLDALGVGAPERLG